MIYLALASCLWAFSFGLIKRDMGGLDPVLLAVARLGLAALAFLPWVRGGWRAGKGRALWLLLLGGVQFGLMYAAYLAAFQHLPAHQVALFTIFTPLYVALLNDALEGRFRPVNLGAALLAVGGAGILALGRDGQWRPAMAGFLLVQASNLCFAAGQVGYRRLMRDTRADAGATAWMYLGALAATLALAVARPWPGFQLSLRQTGVLLYLGLIPSALGFYLWNRGARLARAGTLAVMNNFKIPLAVVAALLCFGEKAEPGRLAVAWVAMSVAVMLTERRIPGAKSGASSGAAAS